MYTPPAFYKTMTTATTATNILLFFIIHVLLLDSSPPFLVYTILHVLYCVPIIKGRYIPFVFI